MFKPLVVWNYGSVNITMADESENKLKKKGGREEGREGGQEGKKKEKERRKTC